LHAESDHVAERATRRRELSGTATGRGLMALPADFLEELRARTPLPALIGRKVRLARAGRQWKGCCPFHSEKTPSFHVYEDHYHCFGCGEHGDAISFVMKSEGLGFMEAVAQLAAEAGMRVPEPSPEAASEAQRQHDLHAVLEAAAQAFVRRLALPEGATARAYLRERGVAAETARRFGLGWSGEGRGALTAELGRQGIGPELLTAAGLLRPAEEDRPAAEMFFGRLMFPIRDGRGRVISFGGRLLGPGQPKYVNGPETAVFVKRRTLFAVDFARAAARQPGTVVLAVEGYMDVIALHQAGFAGAVAPLGTALTEEQLGQLWQLAPEPVLCFDGDAAGGRAAARAALRALPLIDASRSLRLAALPAGEDPDSLLRRAGAGAMQAVIAAARPLHEALFQLFREDIGDSTPEQRARLGKELEAAADRIGDRALAWEYRQAFRARLRAAFRPRPSDAPAVRFPPPLRPPLTVETATRERARALLAILLVHPALLERLAEPLATLELPPPLASLAEALLHFAHASACLDSASLMSHLTAGGLAAAAAEVAAGVPAAARAPAAAAANAEEVWWHFFGLMNAARLDQEIAQAEQDFATHPAAAQRRLIGLCAARMALTRDQGEADP
jgi:DNA primase